MPFSNGLTAGVSLLLLSVMRTCARRAALSIFVCISAVRIVTPKMSSWYRFESLGEEDKKHDILRECVCVDFLCIRCKNIKPCSYSRVTSVNSYTCTANVCYMNSSLYRGRIARPECKELRLIYIDHKSC